jgi:hypothetical protein
MKLDIEKNIGAKERECDASQVTFFEDENIFELGHFFILVLQTKNIF